MALKFADPEPVLKKLAILNDIVVASDLPVEVKALRTRKLRWANEARQAALFAWALKHWMNVERVEFAMHEAEDYDAVFRWMQKEELCYKPVQLKELVGERWNSAAHLQDLINGLLKYGDSQDLAVGIYLNRTDLSERKFNIPVESNVGQIFLYGCCSSDGREWFISGDHRKDQPALIKLRYPVPS